MKNMLSTARAIIVDDKYDQVEPAIKALARLGIGSVYLSGQFEDLPPSPLHGIRLAVVDMDLGLGAVGQSDKDTALQTLAFLGQALAEDSNPLMVVVWTGSDGVYEQFAARFSEALPNVTPAVICRLDKNKFAGDVEAAAEAFEQIIVSELQKVRPLDVLWAWEQAVHDAASRTTSTLSDVIRSPGLTPAGWPDAASNLLAAIARAATGQRLNDSRDMLDDLLGTLEPLLQDRIEHHRIADFDALKASADIVLQCATEQRDANQTLSGYRSNLADYNAFNKVLASVDWDEADIVVDAAGTGKEPNKGRRRSRVAALASRPQQPAKSAVSEEQAARLNGMLQWSVVAPETIGVRPGNVYFIGEPGTACRDALDKIGVDLDRLRKDTLGRSDREGTPVLVEATPACDYAQGKWTMPRFVLGFLADSSVRAKLASSADYLRIYGNAWHEIPGNAAARHLVLNSHFTLAAGMAEAESWPAALRLRRAVLIDVQVWLSSQHMRQGLLSVVT